MADHEIKIRLKGHETFILREGWVTKGLHEVSHNSHVFMENYGADALGVGTNMAKAIRYWLRESNLTIKMQAGGIELSDIGKIIYEQDPYLEDDFALWIMHVNLVGQLNTVTSWYLFFNTLDAEDFTKEELNDLMKRQLLIETGHEDISLRSLSDDCNAIISMYCRTTRQTTYDPEDKSISPFAKFGLLKLDGNRYRKGQPNLNLLHEYVVLYILQQYFYAQQTESVSIGDLLSRPNTPGRVLNMNRTTLNNYLDILENKEFIRITRTAGLDMVYKKSNWKPVTVVANYYKMIEG